MIHAVAVVPMFEPMMTLIACARRNESDDHDGDYRRRLDDHRRHDARADSGQAVRGRERHEPAKARSADGLEALGQMLHPQQECAESTTDNYKN